MLHNRLTKNSNSTAKHQQLTVRGIHHRVPRAAHLVEATNQHIRITALDSTAIQIQQHFYLIKNSIRQSEIDRGEKE